MKTPGEKWAEENSRRRQEERQKFAVRYGKVPEETFNHPFENYMVRKNKKCDDTPSS